MPNQPIHLETTFACRICQGRLTEKLVLKEMQLGFRDEFEYGVCEKCKAIQILQIPADIDRYYPDWYGPFNAKPPVLKKLALFKRIFNRIRINRKYRLADNPALNIMKPTGAGPQARILDIGCGNGAFICRLHNLGFYNVGGIDKFIPQPIDYGHGLQVVKKDVYELQGNNYDVLMMHHVLEHLDDQQETLAQCNRLLKKGGYLIVGIPIVGEAYRIYGKNWIQLDAPRHYIIHTLASMDILAGQTGFSIDKVTFDSTAFQFLGSELYQQDIPMFDPITHRANHFEKHFSAEQIEKFSEKAAVFNKASIGDQALFYLKKI